MSINFAAGLIKHFFNLEQFQRFIGSMPLLLNFYERASLLQDINNELFSKNDVGFVHPEFMLWAITGSGITSVRRDY